MTLQTVTFYQYVHDSVERTVCKLLEKVYTTGMNCLVVCNSREQMSLLDSMIWTYATMSFLPHASLDAPDSTWPIQPIFITDHLHNPNHARIAMVTSGTIIEGDFEKGLDLFSESQEKQALQRIAHYKEKGVEVNMWKQDIKGAWHRAA